MPLMPPPDLRERGHQELQESGSKDLQECGRSDLQECGQQTGREHGDQPKKLIFESINVTNLSTNQTAVMSRGADILLMQEHRLTGNELKKVTDNFKEAGYTLLCSSCEASTEYLRT